MDFDKHSVGGKQVVTLGFDTSVTGRRFGDDEKLAAIVMDSSRADAKNLGTPNETVGGPGKGAGGEKGEKFENTEDRGLVFIIS